MSENILEMKQMGIPVGAIDENVIENIRTYFCNICLKVKFIKNWKVDGAFNRPKGITRNSKCLL